MGPGRNGAGAFGRRDHVCAAIGLSPLAC